MSEEEKIESSLQDGKFESQKEVHDETQAVKSETLNVNEATETINQKSEIKQMEVHHHPHVEKKNFKEYFLEFLMIFLAVTLGFFAENVREHIGDASKEKRVHVCNV